MIRTLMVVMVVLAAACGVPEEGELAVVETTQQASTTVSEKKADAGTGGDYLEWRMKDILISR